MIEQGSPEWFEARCGCVTASRIADLMTKTKSGYGAGRKNYAAQLLAERLSGETAESYSNSAMQWGVDTEPMARQSYEFLKGVQVREVGFILHPRLEKCGASPDGFVGEDGLVEIKCPNTATHLATLEGATIDRKYMMQMQFQLDCTERQWCDFVSFDPRLPESYSTHIQRVYRDEPMLADIMGELTSFLDELDKRETELRSKFESAA